MLFAGDLNELEDLAAAQSDYTQTIALNVLAVGSASLQLLQFGLSPLEGRLTGAFRVDGVLRGLGGILPGAFTTTQRNAITTGQGLQPYGMEILNTTTNRREWNVGTDGSPSWVPVGLDGASYLNLGGIPKAPTAAVDTNTDQIATTAFVIGQGYIKTASVSGVYAPLASPAFTGVPIAPTAAVDTNTTQLATTAFVIGQGYLKSATAATIYAPLASPALTGTPTAPTAVVDTATTQIASTAFVINQGYLKSSTATSTYAPLASPALTGSPTAPTQVTSDSTTKIATTAFVKNQLYATLLTPNFTGTPTAPTAAADTNSIQLATTAFVLGQAGNSTPLQASGSGTPGTSLRYSRQDHVHPTPVIPHVEHGSADLTSGDVSVTFTSAFSTTTGLGVGTSANADPGGTPVAAVQSLSTSGFTMHPASWYATDHGTGYYVAAGA